MDRRHFLAASVLATARSLLGAGGGARLGICAFSCHQHWKAISAKHPGVAFSDPTGFFTYARGLGADGIQVALRGTDPKEMRSLVESNEEAYYESDVRLPKSESDLAAFAEELRRIRESGALVARAVFTSGRRYEVFPTREEFRAFHEQARRTLALVEPVARKLRVKVAFENHKDHTAEELAGLMREISSEWIGVLVDTGNNLALLEDPGETLEALAPFAMSVHLKDMALQADETGFLLSEVPLGTGMLDLPAIVSTLRKANPELALNLEMATRDPLRIPCLTDAYYATMPGLRETHLEAALARVRANPPKGPVPSVAGKPIALVLAEEEANNRHGLARMHEAFGNKSRRA